MLLNLFNLLFKMNNSVIGEEVKSNGEMFILEVPKGRIGFNKKWFSLVNGNVIPIPRDNDDIITENQTGYYNQKKQFIKVV